VPIVQAVIRELRDLRQVTTPADLANVLGIYLKKKAIQKGSVIGTTALLITLGIKTHQTQQVASLSELLASFAAGAMLPFAVGSGLAALSHNLTSRYIDITHANNTRFMRDAKKKHEAYHLGVLWDKVYRYEAENQSDPAQRARFAQDFEEKRGMLTAMYQRLAAHKRRKLGIQSGDDIARLVTRHLEGSPHHPGVPPTREAFICEVRHALATRDPQTVEERAIGFSLWPLEIFYNQDPFTLDDVLYDDLDKVISLREISEMISLTTLERIRKTLRRIRHHPLWHTLATRKILIQVGRRLERDNRHIAALGYGAYFTAQHYLLADPAQDDLIAEHFAAGAPDMRRRILRHRRDVIHSVFSPDPLRARRIIGKVYGNELMVPFDIRLLTDPEYAAGRLDQDPQADLQSFCTRYQRPSPLPARRLAAIRAGALRSLEQSQELMARCPAEPTPERLRAAALAYHLGYRGARARPAALYAAIASDQEVLKLTRMLRTIRLLHVLGELQLETYRREIAALGEYGAALED
jgi:hypothetical protein